MRKGRISGEINDMSAKISAISEIEYEFFGEVNDHYGITSIRHIYKLFSQPMGTFSIL